MAVVGDVNLLPVAGKRVFRRFFAVRIVAVNRIDVPAPRRVAQLGQHIVLIREGRLGFRQIDGADHIAVLVVVIALPVRLFVQESLREPKTVDVMAVLIQNISVYLDYHIFATL